MVFEGILSGCVTRMCYTEDWVCSGRMGTKQDRVAESMVCALAASLACMNASHLLECGGLVLGAGGRGGSCPQDCFVLYVSKHQRAARPLFVPWLHPSPA
jgi:hypothetical protein